MPQISLNNFKKEKMVKYNNPKKYKFLALKGQPTWAVIVNLLMFAVIGWFLTWLFCSMFFKKRCNCSGGSGANMLQGLTPKNYSVGFGTNSKYTVPAATSIQQVPRTGVSLYTLKS